jgi:hypothetical protein
MFRGGGRGGGRDGGRGGGRSPGRGGGRGNLFYPFNQAAGGQLLTKIK